MGLGKGKGVFDRWASGRITFLVNMQCLKFFQVNKSGIIPFLFHTYLFLFLVFLGKRREKHRSSRIHPIRSLHNIFRDLIREFSWLVVKFSGSQK